MKEHLAAIVESSSDAIISKSFYGTITSWNGSAERMFGYRESEALYQSIYLIVPEEKREEEADVLRRLGLGERIETFETLRRHRDGGSVAISIAISPVSSQTGQIIGASSIARDLTQTKENEQRLNLLMREVNHRVKNQYAIILAVIRQTATRSRSIDDFEAKLRRRIMALSHSHDLLSQFEWRGIDLAILVAHQASLFTSLPPISQKGHRIALNANAVLNIGMALHELMENSLRFGGPGRREIEITWSVSNTDSALPELEVVWVETAANHSDFIVMGFGGLVLSRIVPSALSGVAQWTVTEGMITWKLRAPLSQVVPQ